MPHAPKRHRPVGALTKQESRKAYDQRRRYEKPWRKWYSLDRWRVSRKIFLQQHPLCDECEAEGRLTPATVVDHDRPHRGNERLFWDVANWRPKCKYHHDRKTGRGE